MGVFFSTKWFVSDVSGVDELSGKGGKTKPTTEEPLISPVKKKVLLLGAQNSTH